MTPARLRNLVILLAVFAAGAALVWKSQQPKASLESPIAKIPDDRLARIEIVVNASTTTIRRTGGEWRLDSPADPADPAAAARLIGALKNFTIGSVLSENPARHSQYAVNDSSAARVQVFTGISDKPTLDLLVGKPSADLSSSYFRFPGDNRVRTADGLSSFLIREASSQLPAMQVIPFGLEEATSFRFRLPKREITLTKSSATWTSSVSTAPLEQKWVSDLEGKLREWRASDVLRSTAPVEAKMPALVLDVVRSTATFTVTVGDALKMPDGAQRPVRTTGRASVLLVSDGSVNDIAAFVDPRR
ncbi:MAG: DUF4340 domain-containing protein [Elusimicrobia bacterium]|nr:DUF4340 domain-containing protein [Elusimicrobiota bacterium]